MIAANEQRGSDLDVLLAVCHAFGSTSEPAEAVQYTVRWAREALAPAPCAVRLLLADRSGRLRVAASDGEPIADWAGSAQRREAMRNKAVVHVNLNHSTGWRLAILPLVCRGESLGVLEAAAPLEAIEERGPTLRAVVSQGAIVLGNARERAAAEREIVGAVQEAALMRALIRARTGKAAAWAVVRLCALRLGEPVAAWLTGEDRSTHTFVGARGVGSKRIAELRSQLASIGRWETMSPTRRDRTVAGFQRIVGAREASVLQVNDLLLLMGAPWSSAAPPLEDVRLLVENVFRNLAIVNRARRWNQHLDLGLAWTAHELRGPLLGAKAAIESLVRTEDVAASEGSLSSSDRHLLVRSARELDRLARQMEALLRWGVGVEQVPRKDTDLVRVVRQAVRSAAMERGDHRVSVSAPSRVNVRGDGETLRLAIANLVRNALSYSPAHSPVTVSVESRGETVSVSVEDSGSGVASGDRERIFHPFYRGNSGRQARSGSGLGLFIARRIVEAHGGAIWLESDGRGSRFHMELPATEFAEKSTVTSAS